MRSKITLEQWQTLIAVVDHDGYANAAEALDKSQSTLSYAIGRLEEQLQIRLFTIKGRKATLTSAGLSLYQSAKRLLEEARLIEELAGAFRENHQASITLAVDCLFPATPLLETIAAFTEFHPNIRLEIIETVLSGTQEVITKQQADLVLTGNMPMGFHSTPVLETAMMPVAHQRHPLHQLNTPIEDHQLTGYRQIVVRDSGSQSMDAGWLQSQQRITVSQFSTSLDMINAGLGFAWIPYHLLKHPHYQEIKPLTLRQQSQINIPMFLIQTKEHHIAPAVKTLSELLVLKSRGFKHS